MSTTAPQASRPATFLDAQQILAAQLPSYTRREHQERLAAAIEECLASPDGRLLAQAGTGIGKSLAALIPAILSGNRTIVATSTKALQAQYANKDLPFLEEHLGGFTWAVLKGRSNYACLAKLADLENVSPAQSSLLQALQDPDSDGDRENLPTVADHEWSRMSMTATECPGAKDCPLAKQCFAERAKAKAADADIVITNTAYLAQDLILRLASDGDVQLLGDYYALVVDEAHNLESAITGALEDSIGDRGLLQVARDVDGYLFAERQGELAAQVRAWEERMAEPGAEPEPRPELNLPGRHVTEATAALWAKLTEGFEKHVALLNGKADPLRLTRGLIIKNLQDEILTLNRALRSLYTEIENTYPVDDKGKLAKIRLERRVNNWVSRLTSYAITDDAKIARWLEQKTSVSRGQEVTRLFLCSAPISIAEFMTEGLWSREIPVVMMSATLATGQGSRAFSYVREQLGLAEATEFDAGSPFDYTTQAMLYVPDKDVPKPKGADMPAWRSYAQQVTEALVEAARGGALLLYTSRSAMNDAHRRLAPVFEQAGLTVLKQGDAPNSVLARQFKEDEDSVLFGLRSFFEGVDVQGRSLRLVVLDKLPFSVPTDVLHAARSEAIEAKGGFPFYKLDVPEMSLVLIQAFGRLIRHRDDRGVVAILDSRLMGARYGSRILSSLPPAPQTTDIHEAMQFLA